MRWLGRGSSGNVEDRRGMGGPLAIGGGLGAVVLVIISMLMGGNPLQYLNTAPEPTENAKTPEKDEQAKFVSVVLKDTEEVWGKIFSEQLGKTYQEPKLVIFSRGVQSGCGNASSSTGPFYCPLDGKVYIDLSFYDDLKSRFDAPGDFAMAYVIAHEVGHHVQNLMGLSDKVRQQQEGASEKNANKYSVKLELQADFLAGVWAHYDQKYNNVLEPGDIEEALTAANAIGDDRLQKQAQGEITPDAFTHGTSEQRMYWFKKGYDTGDITQGYELVSPN
ncbi:MAG: neutral zinc metallopeptidase [Opitutaceae bacterium]|nr:neutral zinc metallopeptidase [Cytophagales bacterium]